MYKIEGWVGDDPITLETHQAEGMTEAEARAWIGLHYAEVKNVPLPKPADIVAESFEPLHQMIEAGGDWYTAVNVKNILSGDIVISPDGERLEVVEVAKAKKILITYSNGTTKQYKRRVMLPVA